MRALGIGAPETAVVIPIDCAERFDQQAWVFKAVIGERLKQVKGAAKWVVAISKIPRSVTISYLRSRYGVVAEKCKHRGHESAVDPTAQTLVNAYDTLGTEKFAFSSEHDRDALLSMRRQYFAAPTPDAPKVLWAYARTLLWTGKVDLRDDFFADFELPRKLKPIQAAIAWNSVQMLRIHAARLFLGTSSAHASNILTDRFGNLSTIDFELILRSDSVEIRQLFANIRPRTRAFEALRPVANLRGEQIRAVFDELPPVPFPWPLGSKAETVAYYVARLNRWQRLFEERNSQC